MQSFDFTAYGKIGVLYGGTSAERDISLKSGRAVLAACERLGIDSVGIDIDGDNIIETLVATNIDTAFIALHGGIGEDGRLQSLLDFMGILYTGSDFQASVIALNKLISKQIWLGLGLPTPQFRVLTDNIDFEQVITELNGSVIVKPTHEGSSLGMAVATTGAELSQAYQAALAFDTSVFAEQLLTGSEYTIAILDGQILPSIKLETDHLFYDYDAKYISNDTRYICPCGLSPEKEDELKALSLWAFDSLQCKGWGRVDVMVDENDQFQVLEVNTVPGLTNHSLVPMAAKALGYSFEELIGKIITSIKV